MSAASTREQFLAQLFTAPLLRGDAVVVLCGEDALARVQTGAECMRSSCASTMVLTGGVHYPPRVLSAEDMAAEALALGVAPANLIIEPTAKNTRDQSTQVIELAQSNKWKRLLIVASSYHLPRAYLTFLAAVDRVTPANSIHLVPVPSTALWKEPVPHGRGSRLAHFDTELQKIAKHQQTGDCATYRRALQYFMQTDNT